MAEHEVPARERVAVPFHGVPGRGAALRTTFEIAHRLGARALVLLEADMVSATADWIPRLAGPVLDGKADFVAPAYARHRYEGTISRLLLARSCARSTAAACTSRWAASRPSRRA